MLSPKPYTVLTFQAIKGSDSVSASMLRSQMGPWAITGLGTPAGTSLQTHFDGRCESAFVLKQEAVITSLQPACCDHTFRVHRVGLQPALSL